MTTGRINQVCQMLPRTVQPHESTWHGKAPAANKYPKLFTTYKCSAWNAASTTEQEELTTWRQQESTSNCQKTVRSTFCQLTHGFHTQTSRHSTQGVPMTTRPVRHTSAVTHCVTSTLGLRTRRLMPNVEAQAQAITRRGRTPPKYNTRGRSKPRPLTKGLKFKKFLVRFWSKTGF